MKKFSFRLEKVLQYKKVIEGNKKKELAKHVSAYNKVQEEMNGVIKQKQQILTHMNEEGLKDMQFLTLSKQSFFGIEQTLINGKIKLKNIQKQIDKAREAYLVAKQERESLEKLKEKAYSAYLKEVKKEEAKVIEAYSMRMWQERNTKEYEWT